jgi:hypothetical protein
MTHREVGYMDDHGPVSDTTQEFTPFFGASDTAIAHEAFEREAVLQRIVDHLRACDLNTLESMAHILDQGRASASV